MRLGNGRDAGRLLFGNGCGRARRGDGRRHRLGRRSGLGRRRGSGCHRCRGIRSGGGRAAGDGGRRLTLHLEDLGERRHRGRAAHRLGREGRQARRVAVAAVTVVPNHRTVLQLDHAALHLVDEVRFVRGHDHRRPSGVDAGQQPHDVDRGAGVEVSGRFVREQHLRTIHQGASDGHALLLSSRELVRHPLLLAGQAHQGEHLRHRLLYEGAGGADHLQGEGDVLEDGLARKQAEVLEHGADVTAEVGNLATGQRAQVTSEHDDATVARHLLAQDEAQTRRLPRSRRADEEDELAAEHLEVDVVERGALGAAIALGDVLEPDHGETSLGERIRHTLSDTRARPSHNE